MIGKTNVQLSFLLKFNNKSNNLALTISTLRSYLTYYEEIHLRRRKIDFMSKGSLGPILIGHILIISFF